MNLEQLRYIEGVVNSDVFAMYVKWKLQNLGVEMANIHLEDSDAIAHKHMEIQFLVGFVEFMQDVVNAEKLREHHAQQEAMDEKENVAMFN